MATSVKYTGYKSWTPSSTPTSDLDDGPSSRGTYYVNSPEKVSCKRCPTLLQWILIVICAIALFLIGWLVGSFVTPENDGDPGGDFPNYDYDTGASLSDIGYGSKTKQTGHSKVSIDDVKFHPETLESIHENTMYGITAPKISSYLNSLPPADATLASSEWDLISAQKIKESFERLKLDDVQLKGYDVVFSQPDLDNPNKLVILNGTEETNTVILQEQQFTGRLVVAPQDSGIRDSHKRAVHEERSAPNVVQGPVVYAHYGRLKDFEVLKSSGVETQNAVLLIRLSALDRSEMAKRFFLKIYR